MNEPKRNTLNQVTGSLSEDYRYLLTEKPYIAATIKKHCPCGIAFDIQEKEIKRLHKFIQENVEVSPSEARTN